LVALGSRASDATVVALMPLVPKEELRPDEAFKLKGFLDGFPEPGHEAGFGVLKGVLDEFPAFQAQPEPAPKPLDDFLGTFPEFGTTQGPPAGPDSSGTPPSLGGLSQPAAEPSEPVRRTLDYLAKLGGQTADKRPAPAQRRKQPSRCKRAMVRSRRRSPTRHAGRSTRRSSPTTPACRWGRRASSRPSR
jgi:hypothetical protein